MPAFSGNQQAFVRACRSARAVADCKSKASVGGSRELRAPLRPLANLFAAPSHEFAQRSALPTRSCVQSRKRSPVVDQACCVVVWITALGENFPFRSFKNRHQWTDIA